MTAEVFLHVPHYTFSKRKTIFCIALYKRGVSQKRLNDKSPRYRGELLSRIFQIPLDGKWFSLYHRSSSKNWVYSTLNPRMARIIIQLARNRTNLVVARN